MICPICEGNSNFYTKREKGTNIYNYYICETCGSIFIDPHVIELMDKGESIVSYENDYWDQERLDGGAARTFGPNIARMAETFFYVRRPIKKFLDIGGGNGKFLDAVSAYLPASKEIFYSVEKYPPKETECTKSNHYYKCNYSELDLRFDAGICIEVIEHLTPTMLTSLFKDVATVLNPGAGIIINSGQPDYVLYECPQYLEPFYDGHIISYSVNALQKILKPLGFNIKRIKGKSWACYAEYMSESQDEVVDRVWSPLAENIEILNDPIMGSVLKILGLESIRSYSNEADLCFLSKKIK